MSKIFLKKTKITKKTSFKASRSNWTPSKINTVFWYDASDLSTITASGNQVTQMLDKSGNGRTIAPLTLNRIGPSTGTRTLNGLNVLDYDKTVSSNQVLEINEFNQPQPLCIAFVNRLDDEGIAGDQDWLFSGTESTTPRIGLRRLASTSSWQILTDSGAIGSSTNSAEEGFEYIGSCYFAGAGNQSTLRINGSFLNSGIIANNTFSSLNLGASETETLQADGFIAEILSFTDPTKQEIVEGYLAWKWGLVEKLPIQHPYKNSRPKI